MDIANEFEEVGLLFAENRLVAVLEKMSGAFIFAVEISNFRLGFCSTFLALQLSNFVRFALFFCSLTLLFGCFICNLIA